MLKALFIKNVILIEEAQVDFESGFNVLSGESGSGKTAVMHALQLALGAKGDVDLIRHGQEKAIVEAHFDIQANNSLQQFLEEKGIDLEDPSCLILKRELNVNGKGRAFMNHRPVQVSLMKEIGEKLVEIVSQHANHHLFNISYHRQLLDSYGKLHEIKEAYQNLWSKNQELSKKIQKLKDLQPGSLREIESCKREIEEIENSQLKQNEEQQVYEEYALLSSVEERLQISSHLEQLLSSDTGAMGYLVKARQQIQELAKLDRSFQEEAILLQQATLEIEECFRSVSRYQSSLEVNQDHLYKLDQRLKEIHRLKLKYGNSFEEIQNYLLEQKNKLKQLTHLEEELDALLIEQAHLNSHLIKSANLLTQARLAAASNLEVKMNIELHALNMPHANFKVQITQVDCNSMGQDQIEFFLCSNTGERTIPLKEGISGGELARVILALHLIDAQKERTPTLIFDEIEASIGGTTAHTIGQIFKKLGKSQQIFSITHFPQVAKHADHHLQISKQLLAGRTFTAIQSLSIEAREAELQRMIGG